jgi:hypothetical protein
MADMIKPSDAIEKAHPGLTPLPPPPKYLANAATTTQSNTPLTEYRETLRTVPESRKPAMLKAIVEAMMSGKEVLDLDQFTRPMTPADIAVVIAPEQPINKSHAVPPPAYVPPVAPPAMVDTIKKRNIIRE